MQEQAASMQRLVEDLLTLSALESEQNPLADESFAIVPLLLHDLGRREGAVAGPAHSRRSTSATPRW